MKYPRNTIKVNISTVVQQYILNSRKMSSDEVFSCYSDVGGFLNQLLSHVSFVGAGECDYKSLKTTDDFDGFLRIEILKKNQEAGYSYLSPLSNVQLNSNLNEMMMNAIYERLRLGRRMGLTQTMIIDDFIQEYNLEDLLTHDAVLKRIARRGYHQRILHLRKDWVLVTAMKNSLKQPQKAV
jgi:hypothetical protein